MQYTQDCRIGVWFMRLMGSILALAKLNPWINSGGSRNLARGFHSSTIMTVRVSARRKILRPRPLLATPPTVWVEQMTSRARLINSSSYMYMTRVRTFSFFFSALPATFQCDGQLQLVKKLGTRKGGFFSVQSCHINVVVSA